MEVELEEEEEVEVVVVDEVEEEEEEPEEGMVNSKLEPLESTTFSKYFGSMYPRLSPAVNITPFADRKNSIPSARREEGE